MRSDDSFALEIRNVVRRYGATTALHQVSLSVVKGEILCLAGSSGCGKSTLLRVIAGVERPDKGEILLRGKMVTGEGRHVEPERRNVGFMFQDYALFPHLSVRNNILFGLREIGREAAHERCARIIARLGIDHLADRHPHMLSGGEQQRVALARAVVPQPEVLLMDEPFSNLDRGLRNDVREQTVSLLRELGTTVLMVTHDPEEALSVGDRVALMRDGQLEQIGAGADLYNHPASVYAAEFFGIVNRLTGTSQHGRVETRLGHFMMPHAHDGQTVSILIRPHDLRLAPADDGNAGTVSHCTLMGEVEQICVSMDGLCKPLIVRSTNWLRLDAGTRVSISVEAGKALLF